ncbi:MAG TPA: hypothetical protein VNN72_22235 [Polyangiaceae bacterium]|nr:hypothetical protein [Polyangiaceae bacterium]
MSGRSVTRLPLFVFASFCGICFAAACSSDTTNYFGTPIPSAGKGAAGTGGSVAAAGGTDGESGGTGGSTGGTDAMGGTPSAGTTSAGGSGGTMPNQGGTGNGGSTEGGMSGEGGAGETNLGGTGGTGGTQQTGGEGGMQGGMAGEPGGGTGGTSVGGTGGTGAGTGGTSGQPGVCDADGDCASTEYCKKSSCDAAMGTCTERPASCTGNNATLNPVCGCDHMTYYTACVAAHEGINVASSGACGSGAATCNRYEGGSSCSPMRARAACYRTRSTNSCNSGSPPNDGVCWVLPETCPTEAKLELDCNNGDTPICRGLCDALEKNRPLIRNSTQCD